MRGFDRLTLGLCGGLIRQRELNDQSYLASDSFKRIAQSINTHCAITGLPRNGANSVYDSATMKELDEAKEKIRELQCRFGQQNPMSRHADDEPASPKRKKQRLSKKSAGEILRTLEDVCDKHKASVASVLGHLCSHDPSTQPSEARDIISEIVTKVTEKKGVKRGLEALVPDILQQYLHQFRVPDWVLLYFKLEAKIPDEGWQTMMNLFLHFVPGKDQVMVGLVPINTPLSSSQSCKAVFPLAIANFETTHQPRNNNSLLTLLTQN